MDPFPGFQEYEVQDRLGSGGMGKVYRAVNRKTGRVVAFKVEDIRAHEDPEWHLRERFLREARILQGLHHENLTEFYAIGQVPDGRMYIALELLVGRPLSVFTGASLETLVPLFIQCARALEAIAAAGVIHRDVSPENFFVVEVGGHSVVKLIDFGLSKDFHASTEGLTRVGTFLGKPRYSSPEQAGLVPGAKGIDWRTDLYSFGLTMHRLATSKDLFPGRTPEDQIHARGKELSRDALADIHPPRLRKLFARMIRLRPDQRPDSFDEVLVELLRIQSELAAELAVRVGKDVREKKAKSKKLKLKPQQIAPEEGPTVRMEEPASDPGAPAGPPSEPLARSGAIHWLWLLALPAAAFAAGILFRRPSARPAATVASVAKPPGSPVAKPPASPAASAAARPPEAAPAPLTPAASPVSPAPAPATVPEARTKKAEASHRPAAKKARIATEAPPPPAPPVDKPAATARALPEPPAPAPATEIPSRVRPGELVGPGPGVSAPVVAGEIRVEYPASTRRLGISGEVVVLVEVDETGKVIEGRVLRGTRIESVDQAVLAAIRATPFTPPTKDGVPVKMWTTVRFALRP